MNIDPKDIPSSKWWKRPFSELEGPFSLQALNIGKQKNVSQNLTYWVGPPMIQWYPVCFSVENTMENRRSVDFGWFFFGISQDARPEMIVDWCLRGWKTWWPHNIPQRRDIHWWSQTHELNPLEFRMSTSFMFQVLPGMGPGTPVNNGMKLGPDPYHINLWS